MDTDRLEEACKQLRLSHIPRGFETKEDWLLFFLENELTCRDELKKVRLFKQAKWLRILVLKHASGESPDLWENWNANGIRCLSIHV